MINIQLKKKNIEYLDKEVQSTKFIIKKNKNIIQKQKEIKIIGKKDIIFREYEEKIKILKKELKLIEEKDKVIIKLSKINSKLKNSLELISRQMDSKIENMNLNKNKNKLNNALRLNNNLSYETELNQKSFSENLVKEKELNNAISIIKILKLDNQKLQNKLDEIEKNKEIEKQNQDKNQILMQRELQDHKLCKQKIESLHEKIKKLTEKNKGLVDKLIYGKNKIGNKTNNNNLLFNESDDDSDEDNGGNYYKIKKKLNNLSINRLSKKSNLINLKKFGVIKKSNSLPKINIMNSQQLNSNKNIEVG
jgi:hypothetical protein